MLHGKTFLLLVSLSVFLVGCSGEAERAVALRKTNLSTLGVGYHAFYSNHERTPKDADELAEFLREEAPDNPATEDALKSLRDKDIVVLWDGVIDEADKDQPIVAFEASVPGSGGYVVTLGGSVELITASQFASATLLPTREAETEAASE